MSLKKADKIIAVSHNTKNDIIRYFPEVSDKIETIYEAISLPFLANSADYDTDRQILEKYNIHSPYIFFVGMIEPRKNLYRLIRSYDLLRKKYRLPHKLVITGQKGWKYEAVFEEIQALQLSEHIIFTGYVTDEELACLYRRADVFVYPSLYEGFGLPVIEAMASGTVVVTSNNSSLCEITGDAAQLCEPTDIEDISDKIWQVISSRRLQEELVEKGLKRACQFSWKKTAQQTLSVYKELV